MTMVSVYDSLGWGMGWSGLKISKEAGSDLSHWTTEDAVFTKPSFTASDQLRPVHLTWQQNGRTGGCQA